MLTKLSDDSDLVAMTLGDLKGKSLDGSAGAVITSAEKVNEVQGDVRSLAEQIGEVKTQFTEMESQRTASLALVAEATLRDVFEKMDTERAEGIIADELYDILADAEVNYDPKELAPLIAAADPVGGGEIDFDGLETWLNSDNEDAVKCRETLGVPMPLLKLKVDEIKEAGLEDEAEERAERTALDIADIKQKLFVTDDRLAGALERQDEAEAATNQRLDEAVANATAHEMSLMAAVAELERQMIDAGFEVEHTEELELETSNAPAAKEIVAVTSAEPVSDAAGAIERLYAIQSEIKSLQDRFEAEVRDLRKHLHDADVEQELDKLISSANSQVAEERDNRMAQRIDALEQTTKQLSVEQLDVGELRDGLTLLQAQQDEAAAKFAAETLNHVFSSIENTSGKLDELELGAVFADQGIVLQPAQIEGVISSITAERDDDGDDEVEDVSFEEFSAWVGKGVDPVAVQLKKQLATGVPLINLTRESEQQRSRDLKQDLNDSKATNNELARELAKLSNQLQQVQRTSTNEMATAMAKLSDGISAAPAVVTAAGSPAGVAAAELTKLQAEILSKIESVQVMGETEQLAQAAVIHSLRSDVEQLKTYGAELPSGMGASIEGLQQAITNLERNTVTAAAVSSVSESLGSGQQASSPPGSEPNSPRAMLAQLCDVIISRVPAATAATTPKAAISKELDQLQFVAPEDCEPIPYVALSVPFSRLPAGVDPRLREAYMSNAEFVRVMGCTKGTFKTMAKWRRNALKKDRKLIDEPYHNVSILSRGDIVAYELEATAAKERIAAFSATTGEGSAVYALAELKGVGLEQLPEGADPRILEQYLSDAEFESALGLSKAAFGKLPRWRQNRHKREAQLIVA